MQPDLEALFQKIDSLRDELSDLMPLKKEDEDRLWRKFRFGPCQPNVLVVF